MHDSYPHLATLSQEERRHLENNLLLFDQEWHAGRLAEFLERLPPSEHRLRAAALREMVKVDLDRQWQAGRKKTVEDYLNDFPELGTKETVAPDLIQAEYFARQHTGDTADLAQFAQRFPKQADQFRLLIRQALSAVQARDVETRDSRATPSPAGKTLSPSAMRVGDGRRPKERVLSPRKGPPAGKQLEQPVELPEKFGRYKLMKRLGQGGMGAVYLAHDTELHRDVALKVPHVTTDCQEIVERFYREARSAAGLSHPNICPIHDVGQINGRLYLTMAYVEGKPLSAFIQPGKPIAPIQAAQLVRKIALALEEAHRKGIIHRDLKPANIMINLRKEPVIMDFGLAKRAGGDDIRLTKSGAVVGTPAYMSPEQVAGQDAGPGSDIYSLGVILYELLTGNIPFDGPAMAVLGAILTQEPPKPSQFRGDLDPKLETICLKALAKKPEERYASMAEFAAALAKHVSATAAKPKEAHAPKGDDTFVFTDAARTQSPSSRGMNEVNPGDVSRPHPAKPPRSRKPLWIGVAVVSAGAVALLSAVIILLSTPGGTIKIEVDDPNIKVAVDGKDIRIEDVAMPLAVGPHNLSLKVGNQTLTIGKTVRVHNEDKKLAVTFGDYELRGDTFTIVRGENPVMKISLLPVAAEQGRVAENQKLGDQNQVPDGQAKLTAPAAADKDGWTPAELSSASSWTWGKPLAGEHKVFVDGALTLDNMAVNLPHMKDGAVRANVKYLEGQTLTLTLRSQPMSRGGYYANYSNRGDGFYFALAKSDFNDHRELKAVRVNPHAGYFVFEFAAVGPQLTVRVNGAVILEARDPTYAEGLAGLSAYQARGIFKDVKVADSKADAIEAAPTPEEWVSLFNGQDLAGWKSPPDQKGDWRVENGVLVGRGPQLGHLFTERDDFTDFHFLVEARINAKGNSGQVFRAPQMRSGHPGGYEAQIDSGSHGNKTGSLYVMPKQNGSFIKNVLVPPNTWFTQEVIAQGNRIIIKVNDKVVTDFTDANRTYHRGHLALQVWDPPTVVEFRRVAVKETKQAASAAPAASAGWMALEPGVAASWSWGNRLVGPGHKSYADGLLSLDNGPVSFNSAKATDSVLRAKVKFDRGQNVACRCANSPRAAATIMPTAIGIPMGTASSISASPSAASPSAASPSAAAPFAISKSVRRDVFPAGFVDMEFAAVGERLSVV